MTKLSVVTGAFGYTGKYIARLLLSEGHRVKTLTGHPRRSSRFGEGEIEVARLDFDDPAALARDMEGSDVLYNTYWIRYSHGEVTFETAVRNTQVLIGAAQDAGVCRLVHISITNASASSRLPYFRGKGLAEEAVLGSGLSHAIIRPTLVFGKEDVLVNNIAWFLRRFPVFAIFGSGDYAVQPVFVEDVARIAVDASKSKANETIEAVGPETLTFEELVRTIAVGTGSNARLMHLPPGLALTLARFVGYLKRDVALTRNEVEALMDGLLVGSEEAPTAPARFSDWVAENATLLGKSYSSEVRRHWRRES